MLPLRDRGLFGNSLSEKKKKRARFAFNECFCHEKCPNDKSPHALCIR